MGIGYKVKLAPNEEHKTIAALSNETGIPVNTLYSITKRDNKRCDRIIIEKIAAALNKDVDWFLDDKSSTIAERIKQCRQAANLSGIDLARKLNTSFTTIYQWENSKRIPRADSLVKLATALHTSPEYLLTGNESRGIPTTAIYTVNLRTGAIINVEVKYD